MKGEVTFAGTVSEEVVSECPAHPPSSPMKQTCPARTRNLESAARKGSSKIPTIPRGGDSENSSGRFHSPVGSNSSPATPESCTSVRPTQCPDGGDFESVLVWKQTIKRPRDSQECPI